MSYLCVCVYQAAVVEEAHHVFSYVFLNKGKSAVMETKGRGKAAMERKGPDKAAGTRPQDKAADTIPQPPPVACFDTFMCVCSCVYTKLYVLTATRRFFWRLPIAYILTYNT